MLKLEVKIKGQVGAASRLWATLIMRTVDTLWMTVTSLCSEREVLDPTWGEHTLSPCLRHPTRLRPSRCLGVTTAAPHLVLSFSTVVYVVDKHCDLVLTGPFPVWPKDCKSQSQENRSSTVWLGVTESPHFSCGVCPATCQRMEPAQVLGTGRLLATRRDVMWAICIYFPLNLLKHLP